MRYRVIDVQSVIFPTFFKTKREAMAYIEMQNANPRAIAKNERLKIEKIK